MIFRLLLQLLVRRQLVFPVLLRPPQATPMPLGGVIPTSARDQCRTFDRSPSEMPPDSRPSIICPRSASLRIPKSSSDTNPSDRRAPSTAAGSLTRMESSFAGRPACSASAEVERTATTNARVDRPILPYKCRRTTTCTQGDLLDYLPATLLVKKLLMVRYFNEATTWHEITQSTANVQLLHTQSRELTQLRFGLAAALNRMAAPHRAAPATRAKADGQFFSPANAAQRIEDLIARRIRRTTWTTQVSSLI